MRGFPFRSVVLSLVCVFYVCVYRLAIGMMHSQSVFLSHRKQYYIFLHLIRCKKSFIFSKGHGSSEYNNYTVYRWCLKLEQTHYGLPSSPNTRRYTVYQQIEHTDKSVQRDNKDKDYYLSLLLSVLLRKNQLVSICNAVNDLSNFSIFVTFTAIFRREYQI